MFRGLEAAFLRVRGSDAIQKLIRSHRKQNVITIGGDQLTGKSTLCKDLVSHLDACHTAVSTEKGVVRKDVTFLSAGKVFRAEAARRGISVGELSKQAINDTDIDVIIEYETCLAIQRGINECLAKDDIVEHTIVIEGRNPAVMGKYCKSITEEASITSIFLSCNPRIQARRFIGREIDRGLAFRIDAQLPDKEYPDQHSVGKEMLKINPTALYTDPVAIAAVQRDALKHTHKTDLSNLPHLNDVIESFMLNEKRDNTDMERFQQAYGFTNDLKYTNQALYDLVQDTSEQQPKETLQDLVELLPTHLTKPKY